MAEDPNEGAIRASPGQLILDAATGARPLAPDELQRVREYVAQAGFQPTPDVRAKGLAGIRWRGRLLNGNDRITAAERHYLEHVVQVQEWPSGTSLQQYLDSIQAVILHQRSGLLTCQYYGQLQLSILRRAHNLQGPDGHPWVLVEYRVELGYWVTAFQPRDGLRVLRGSARTEARWLQRPR